MQNRACSTTSPIRAWWYFEITRPDFDQLPAPRFEIFQQERFVAAKHIGMYVGHHA